jgi:hypothetical protein
MNLKLCGLAAAIALAFATSAVQAQGTPAPQGGIRGEMSAADKADDKRIEADYKAAKAKCDGMKGNAKDICMAEAKGQRKVAKAEHEAKESKDPAAAQSKVDKAKAEAEYDVAKQRCDDQKGKEKSACVEQAKAKRDQALAAVKGEKKAERAASRGASTTSDSTPAKRGY